MSEAKETLIAARALIANAENWCQHAQGRTREGEWTSAWNPDAYQRCALGAISAVEGGTVGNDHPISLLLSKQMDGFLVGPWNNTHSHAEVVAAFDRAIAAENGTDISIFTAMLTPKRESVTVD